MSNGKTPSRDDQADANSSAARPVAGNAPMAPGDEAPPGTPGTGETLCPDCGGKAQSAEGKPCPTCGGTGRVVAGIGGA